MCVVEQSTVAGCGLEGASRKPRREFVGCCSALKNPHSERTQATLGAGRDAPNPFLSS